ncbi:DUF4129 domain-containing protein [Calidifontibacter terrae]
MRRGNVIAVAAAAGFICVLAVALDRPALVTYTDVTPPSYRSPTPKAQFTPPSGASKTNPLPDMSSYGPGLSKLFAAVAGTIVIVAICWLAIAIVRALRNRRRRLHTPAIPLAAPLAEIVADSVDHALADLSLGSPDNAIIRCWVGLQQAAREAGVEPRESETSAELTLRLLDDLTVDQAAVRRLAALYREARFSSHALTEDDRDAAREALTVIRRTLADSAVVHG